MSSKVPSYRSFFLATIIGIILYVVLDAVAQALPPHYSPIRQAESDLAVGPYGYVMTSNFVNRGVLSLLFAFGLYKTVSIASRQKFRAGLALLAVWAFGAIVLAASPTDLPGAPVTIHGEIHLGVATLAFICGAFGILLLSVQLKNEEKLRPLQRYVLPDAIISLILLFLTIFGLSTRIGGLLERLFLGSVLLWMFIVSIYLLNAQRVRKSGKEVILQDKP